MSKAGMSTDQAERRQLTVLFCDLVGSTELSQQLDLEDLRELILGYQQTVSQVVERYEGHIAQYLGDGVLVYFGYPRAYDDDAERAVKAGYHIVAALKDRKTSDRAVQVRIGIHTGSVVIGQVGAGGRHENLALGDTTNIAARLQGIAEPGQIIISRATMKLVPGLFVTKDLGEVALKGIDKSTQVYQVLHPSGVRSRLEASDHLTPFVGRESEMALLLDCWGEAQEGHGQAALITAEPGLGKSRLLLALRERIKDEAHSWLECRASPLTRNSAFQPFIEMLQRALGLQESDSPQARLQRLELGLDALGLRLEEAVPLAALLLKLDLPERNAPLQISPELMRKRTLDMLAAGTLALANKQPLILVVEDLHWADPSSVELLGLLLEQVPTHPLLVLLTARPEFQAPWRTRTHLTALSLRPLRSKEVAQMLDNLAEHKRFSAAVQGRILERAGGVPLFVEEITQMLLESGKLIEKEGHLDSAGSAEDLTIPATLQDSLMARLDRLNESKLLIQLCSVIGREIAYRLLSAVAETDEATLQLRLQTLTDAQLLYPRGAPPDANYLFKHALIQDSAYNSLLKVTRQKLHAAIAQALEKQFPERAKAEPEALALHFDAAGDADNAIRCYKKASDELNLRGAHAEIITYTNRALALLASMPDSPKRRHRELRLQLQLGTSKVAMLGFTHPEVMQAYERARQLCGQVEDPLLVTSSLSNLSISHYNHAHFVTGLQLGDQLIALGEKLKAPIVLAVGKVMSGVNLFNAGKLAEAHALLSAAVTFRNVMAAKGQLLNTGMESHTAGLIWDSWALWLLGYPDQALESAKRAEEEALIYKHPNLTGLANSAGRSWALVLRREPEGAVELGPAAIEHARRYGLTEWESHGVIQHCIASCMLGRQECLPTLQQALSERRARQTPGLLSRYCGMEAEICLSFGRIAEARLALANAFEVVEQHQERFWEAELHRVKGELLRAESTAPGDAEACFSKALEISRAQQAKSLELRAATSLARLWQKQNRNAEARDLLKPVYDWFTEGFDTPDLKDAKTLLKSLA